MVAIVVIAIMLLFQNFATQARINQAAMAETSVIRYLGSAALTEGTMLLKKKFDQASSLQEAFDILSQPQNLDPQETLAFADQMVGRTGTSISVRSLLDRDLGTEDASWGPANLKQWSKIAFKGERGARILLLATVEVPRQGGGKVTAQMSRGYEFRLVSPAPPEGLHNATFVGHNWDYFQGRLEQATQEVFALVIDAAIMRKQGVVALKDRNEAVSTTARWARGLGGLSLVLVESMGATQGNIHSTLTSRLQAKCSGDCGRNLGFPRPPEKIADCLALAPELYGGWLETIRVNIEKARQSVQQGSTTLSAEQIAASQPANPPPPDPNNPDAPPQPVAPGPGVGELSIVNAILQESGAAPLGAWTGGAVDANVINQVQTELFGNASDNGCRGGNIGRVNQAFGESMRNGGSWGLNFHHCERNGCDPFTGSKGFVPLKQARTQVLDSFEKRYGPAWSDFVERVFTGPNGLASTIKKLSESEKTAGKQVTLANIVLWSNFKEEDFEKEIQAAEKSMKELDIHENSQGLDDLTYPTFPSLKPMLSKLQTDLEAGNSPSTPPGSTPAPPTDTNAQLKEIAQNVRQVAQTVLDIREYLDQEDVQNYLTGPVYLSKDDAPQVDSKRLEYKFQPSPHRTDMAELFPVPPAPIKDEGQIEKNTRGFLVTHANWGRDVNGQKWKAPFGGVGERSDGDSATAPVDNASKMPSVADFRETENVALDYATVWNLKQRLSGPDSGFTEKVQEWLENIPPIDGKKIFDRSELDGSPEYDSENPMGGSKGKDSEAVTDYVKKWNEQVKGFKDTLIDTNQVHESPPFKAWPVEAPGGDADFKAATEGWETPPSPGGGPFVSKGQLYLDAVLSPEVNRQRAAFRFGSIQEFRNWVTESQGAVDGTYFIEDSNDPIELDLSTAPFDNLHGYAYLAFPKRLKVKGQLDMAGPDKDGDGQGDGAGEGILVLVAQGIEFEGGSEVRAMVLSNGEFTASGSGNPPSIKGTLVTTGTPTLLPGGEPAEIKANQRFKLKDNPDLTKYVIGELKPFDIEYDDPLKGVGSRDATIRLIFSPYPVAEDFEIRRLQ